MLADLPEAVVLRIAGLADASDVIRLGCTCRLLRAIAEDDAVWRPRAIRKFGWCVENLTKVSGVELTGNWHRYVKKRSNTRASISPKKLEVSPLCLAQEIYTDPWEHLVCCLLVSRTSCSPSLRERVKQFLELVPHASAMLDDDLVPKVSCSPSSESYLKHSAVLDLLFPFGLLDSRLKALKAMSRDFILEDWKDPSEFKGCGKFTSDSWRIFCLGDLSRKDVEDKFLKAYVRWRQSGSIEEAKERKKRKQPETKPVKPKGRTRGASRRASVPDRVLRSAKKS